MSRDTGPDEGPKVFGDGDDGDDAEGAEEQAEAPAATETEPGAPRDLRGEVKAIVLGAAHPMTLEEVHDEVKGTAYVPEGPVRAALEELTADAIIAQKALGDPLKIYFCAPTRAPDILAQRAVCIELAAVPDDRDPASGKLSTFEILAALERRNGEKPSQVELEGVLDALVASGTVSCETQRRTLPAPTQADGDVEAPREVEVTVYGFAPGLLFSLLSPAFNALLAPEEPTTAPTVAGAEAAAASVDGEPDRAALAAARAAMAGIYAQRLDRADKRVAAAEGARNDALRRVAELEGTIARAEQRAADQGLHDIFGSLVAPATPSASDPRGDAIRYEKRVPMTPALKGQFWDESVGIRTEIRGEQAREKVAKKNFDGVKASVAEKLLELETRLDNMTAASRANTYLIVVPRAYKEMDHATRRVGVYDYDTGEFVCWDDPADLPKGSQPALPGLDARDSSTGAAPATDAKVPGAAKKPRKKKVAKTDGGEAEADAGEDSDAEADTETPEHEGGAPAATLADDLPVEDRVARQLARGDDSAFKITLVLGQGNNPVTIKDVEAALVKLAGDGNADARAACIKSGLNLKVLAVAAEAVAPSSEPVAAPQRTDLPRNTYVPGQAPAAPDKDHDAAATAASAAGQAKAEAAAAIVPVKAPPKISLIKLLVMEIVKARPEGVLWADPRGTLHDEMRAAFEVKTADPGVFKTPSMTMLVAGACQSQIQNRVLAEVAVPEGKRLYHPDNGMPGAPASAATEATPEADGKAETPPPAGKAAKTAPKPRARAKKTP